MAASAEQKKALFYSLGLHIFLVLLLFISVNPKPISIPKGSAIEAEIMDLPAKKTAPAKKPPEKKQPPKVEPKPEPEPEPELIKPEPEPEPEPEIIKPEPKPEPKPKPEIKPEPPKPDPEVIKRQQQQAERLEKLKQLRQQRKAAEQTAAQQKIATETTAENETKEDPEENTSGPLGNPTGEANQERTLLTQYIVAIQSAVTRQWSRPVGTDAGLTCQIKVNQIPGGGVIDVTIGSPCNANTVVKNSIINAVKKADPLPYTGFETVFERRLNFIFQYQGD